MKSFLLIVLSVVVISALASCDSVPLNCFDNQILLVPDELKTTLNFSEDALEFLRDPIRANRPVIPITVVGTARSGKSFFLGMVTGCPNFFQVGHTAEGETQGAEMVVCDTIDALSYNHDDSGENITMDGDNHEKPLYLFIDTEGLEYSMEEYDTAILLFSTLISSHMVYHLSEKIEQTEIERLSSIASLIQYLEQNQMITELELPNLTWVVDKFSFKDVSSNFKHIDLSTKEGALQYLFEYRLKEKPNPTGNKQLQQYNDVVNVVHHEFPSQSAFFIHPAVNENNKRVELNKIQQKDMDPRYLAQINSVRELLFETKPKRLRKNKGPNMTCEGFADFIESIIPVLKKGPRRLTKTIIEVMFDEAHDQAISKYHEIMNNLTLPLEKPEFESAEEKAKKEAIHVFEFMAPGGQKGYLESHQRLVKELTTKKREYWSDNIVQSENLCKDVNEILQGEVEKIKVKGIHHQTLKKEITNLVQEAKSKMKGPYTKKCIDGISEDLKKIEKEINGDHEGFFAWLGDKVKNLFS